MIQPSSTQAPMSIRRAALLSVIVVVTGVGIWAVFFKKPAAIPDTNRNAPQAVAATPLSYSMIEGKVSDINLEQQKVVVGMFVIGEDGRDRTKSYTLTIGSETILESANRTVTPATTAPMKLTDLAIGNSISAQSDRNVAALDAFTPTVLTRFITE